MTKDIGASASRPGSREPSPEGLGPSGFDPSRLLSVEQAEALGYVNVVAAPLGHVFSMETSNGYRVVAGSPSYESAIKRARPKVIKP